MKKELSIISYNTQSLKTYEGVKRIYTYVGALVPELCDMSNPTYPKPLKFNCYQDAKTKALDHGYKILS